MTVDVELKEHKYDIVIERDSLNNAYQFLNLDRNVLIVTDDNIPSSYSNAIAKHCKSPIISVIPSGEKGKSLEQFSRLLSIMLNASFSRSDCVVAVGGGVVGDLSGFVSSAYMRGIDFYNIPTTLLSQVDSSIGGKTAVNFEGVKNIVGAFHHPCKVIIDPNTLKTLDKRQINAGLAEAIKMAATCDESLFEFIEQSHSLDNDIEEIIVRSLAIKKFVVEKDPEEKGLRKILNFGHTVGHALESFYKGEMLHGECVAMGMIPMCSNSVQPRLIKLLKKYNLPVQIAPSQEELLPFMLHDKKIKTDKISAVFVEKIGSCEIKSVTPHEILKNI